MKAMDITAPEIRVYLGGEDTALRFDHTAMAQAERYYEATVGEAMGYAGIMVRALRKVYAALAAVAYGAAVSARLHDAPNEGRMSPQAFDACVDYAQLLACREALTAAMIEAWPKDSGKNAEAQGEPA